MLKQFYYPALEDIKIKSVELKEIPESIFDSNIGIVFTTTDDNKITFVHEQDCCECVFPRNLCIIGDDIDVMDLDTIYYLDNTFTGREYYTITKVILTSNYEGQHSPYGDATYSFYEIYTDGGIIDFNFFGTSNGYYSTSVQAYYNEEYLEPVELTIS